MARLAPLARAVSAPGIPGLSAASLSRPSGKLESRAWHGLDNPDDIARWDALARCAAEPNPFYESWYLLPSLRALDRQARVRLVTLEVDGQLAGVMPLTRPYTYYGYPLPHLRNWAHANCFSGQPLVAAGMETLFWRELLDWADRHARAGLFLHLAHIPGDGPLHEALKSVLRDGQRPAATVLDEQRAMLSSSLSAEAYFENSLNAKKRKELRRQHRRLSEEGLLTIQKSRDLNGLGEWIRAFLTLESAGWKGRAGSALASERANARLFAEALQGAAQRGRLERLSLLLDGQPVAMLASFLTPPGAYSYKTTFDERFARYSPGVLLQRENLAMLEDPAIAWVDSCAAQNHAMIDHIWRERRPLKRHSIAIGGAVKRRIFRQLVLRETGKQPGGIS